MPATGSIRNPMQVNPNSATGEVTRTEPQVPGRPPVRVGGDEAEFTRVTALDKALQDIPPARVEEVERAKNLVQDGNYPPPYAIVRIARLLAMHWTGESD
jgi:hypothetical protein